MHIFLGLTILTVGFISAFLITQLVQKHALSLGLVDIPNERSLHVKPTPRGGGLGFVISFLGGLAALYFAHFISFQLLLIFILGGVLIAGVGLLDDLRHATVKIRLTVHTVAAIFVLGLFHGMPQLPLGFMILHWQWFGNFIGVIALVWLINLYNFMDGIDGIAGAEAIFATTAGALLIILSNHRSELIWPLLLLGACVFGFIILNWSPAKIFMGDVGSGFLGFALGIFIIASAVEQSLTPWQWLILLSCFWIDATLTLLRRILKGEAFMQAHCSHAYQVISRYLNSHKKVVLMVMGVNIFGFIMAAISLFMPQIILLMALLMFLIVSLFYFYVLKKMNNESKIDFSAVEIN